MNQKERRKEWRKKNREKCREYSKKYYEKNREKEIKRRMKYYNKEEHRIKMKEWREKNREHIREYERRYRKKYRDRDREKYRKWMKDYRIRIRLQALIHYSGDPPKCVCCSETEIKFLTIDHIHGKGKEHRKLVGVNFYHWLKKNNYPEGYQVLCWNCNLAKALYEICPHQVK